MRVKLFLLMLALLACMSPWALAQRNLDVAGREARVALVIGNAAYADAPLTNPVNDAKDVAAALRKLGFTVIVRTDVSQRDMRREIRQFGVQLRRAEVGLFYFAGHGVQVKGINYFVPVDAVIQSEADAEDMSIDASYVLHTMEEAQAKVSIVILDACRSNPFARSFRSPAGGLAQMTAATGSLMAYATAPGAVAADGSGRNGTYTKHLLASLDDADSDILKVFQRTRAGVVKETGGRQTPWESTSLIGEFRFRQGRNSVDAALPVTTIAAPPVVAIAAPAVAAIAPDPAPPSATPAPWMPKVGDTWKYQYTDGFNTKNRTIFVHRVTSISENQIGEVMYFADKTAFSDRKAFASDPQFVQRELQGMRRTEFAPYLQAFAHDPSFGRLYAVRGLSEHAKPWQISGRLVGRETVIVPAGRFETIKLELIGYRFPEAATSVGVSEGTRTQHLIWYAPSVKRYVKYWVNAWDWNGATVRSDSFELLEYRLN
jgi:hypothetical protein